MVQTRRNKGKQTAKANPVRPGEGKRRKFDQTKIVAVFVFTVVLVLLLWIFNPNHFFGVMVAFVVGTLYGLALPHMVRRFVH